MKIVLTNTDYATCAKGTLDHYAERMGLDPTEEGYEVVIEDLLTDLMHFCRANSLDLSVCLRIAEQCVNEEINAETPQSGRNSDTQNTRCESRNS